MDGITKHESSAPELPTEIWCHILNLITNFRDLISCKRISRQLYSIIKYEKAISNVLGVQLDEEIAAYFTNNKTYPRATKEEIKQYWISCPPEERKSNIDGEYLFLVKTVIVGPSKVKKSALRRTIAQGSYSEDEPYLGSIRVREEFVIVQKLITNSDGVSAKLQIWDTYHAERFKRLILTSYFRGASVVLLCFSVNDRSSLIELLEETLAQCYEHRMRLDHAQFYLVGLKDDLTTDNVSYDEAQWVASELHMKYFEVSCKQYPRGNLNEMLQEIGEDALARMTWSKLHEDNEKPKEKVGSESYSRSNQSRSGLALVISSAVVLVAVAIANLW